MDYMLDDVMTTIRYKVGGVPDTQGASGPRVTIRPEELFVQLTGGEDGTIRHIGIKGRTVRRDGVVTTYREVGWGYYSFRADPLPPAWIVEIIEREGLNWQTEQATQRTADQKAGAPR